MVNPAIGICSHSWEGVGWRKESEREGRGRSSVALRLLQAQGPEFNTRYTPPPKKKKRKEKMQSVAQESLQGNWIKEVREGTPDSKECQLLSEKVDIGN